MIRFRRLAVSDLPLLHRWLNTEHVSRWWGEAGSFEAVVAKYMPRIEGREPTDPHVILLDVAPIGYIQTYLLRDYPEYNRLVAAGDKAAGVDLLIGEEQFLYQGLGPRILSAFLKEVVFAPSEVESCIIDPAVTNYVAIRAYEKVGFRYVRTVQVPGETEPEYLMTINRADVLGG